MRTNHIPRITDDFKMDVTKIMVVIIKFGSNTYQKLSTSHKDVGFPCLVISHLVALSTSKNQIEA